MIRRIKPKPLTVFLIILGIQLALYFFLQFRAEKLTPPGYVHALHNADTYYPDIIRQSAMGKWTYRYPFTTLESPDVIVFPFYLTAGKISALLRISPIGMYELLRVTGAAAILLSTYWLITILFPASLRIPAILLTTVFDTGPVWHDVVTKPVWLWGAAHPELILLTRRFWLPHHLWGEAIGLLLLCTLFRTVQKPQKFAPLLLIILGITGTLTNPSYFFIIGTCVFLPWLVLAFATKQFRRVFPPIAAAAAGIGSASLFTNMQLSVGPPLNNLLASEKSWWSTELIITQFVQSFGLFYPLVISLFILVIFTWKHWNTQMKRLFILTASWSILPAGLIYAAQLPWVPVVNGRIGMDISTVPIGILSTLLLYAATAEQRVHKIVRIAVKILFLGMFVISLLLSSVYFQYILKIQNDEVFGYGYSWTLYQKRDVADSLTALKKVPAWSHIMVNPRIGDIIPAFLPLRVYQGNPYGDIDWIERRRLSYEFYRGDMPRARLLWLLNKNAIQYVYYGVEEKTSTVTPVFYPDLLTPVYSNPEVTIFKVNPLPRQ